MEQIKVKETLASLVEYVSGNAKAVLTSDHDNCLSNCLSIVLAAYNRMQEDEFDGQDYIFDITNQNDLKFLVDRNMITAKQIALAYNEIPFGLFKFDDNGNILPAASSEKELIAQLLQNLDFIVPYVLMYVARCKEYQDFYEAFFTYFSEDRLDPK